MLRKKTVYYLSLIFIILLISPSLKIYATSGQWKSDSKGWWYEFDGAGYPVSTWEKIDGNWYYFKSNGYMDYSAYRDGCWLNSDGSWNTTYSHGTWKADSIGWWYEDNGWYPTNKWLWIDGECYFFKADGYLATSQFIEGCYVDANGKWIPNYKSNNSSDEYEQSYKNNQPNDNNDYSSKEKALQKAKDLLQDIPYSYKDLKKALIKSYHFSENDAKYAVDNCEANWNQCALSRAKNLLEDIPLSYKDLKIYLINSYYFTEDQAQYAVDNCGANWNQCALSRAKNLLEDIPLSYKDLKIY